MAYNGKCFATITWGGGKLVPASIVQSGSDFDVDATGVFPSSGTLAPQIDVVSPDGTSASAEAEKVTSTISVIPLHFSAFREAEKVTSTISIIPPRFSAFRVDSACIPIPVARPFPLSMRRRPTDGRA